MEPSRLSYCQYLLASQINYTLTHFAEHAQGISHDAMNRHLRRDHATGSALWNQVRTEIVHSPNAYLVFDDTVLDKNYSHRIELARHQYSGNEHKVVKGIGVVNCVYVNPDMNAYWPIDFRVYDPDGDGKSKLDHVQDMLNNVVRHKCLPFAAVLMDSWYATRKLMRFIESLQLCYVSIQSLHLDGAVDCVLRAKRQQRIDVAVETGGEFLQGIAQPGGGIKTVELGGGE
jgi:hypothetical protein